MEDTRGRGPESAADMTPPPPGHDVDYRWSLANERTFLAWIRTSLALVAGGVAAAKLADFQHELVRWVIAGPPLVAGAMTASRAAGRWRTYEDAMRRGASLPVGRGVGLLAHGLAAYGAVVVVALALDG